MNWVDMNFRIVRERLRTPAVKRVHFDAKLDLSAAGVKRFDAVRDGDIIIDYKNVRLSGYLSTFWNTDRDGDRVVKGAFLDSIPRFMQNPVLLVNHANDVRHAVGIFTKVAEDDTGLYVEAKLSDSPAELTKDIRFKVAEGILRTLSMGGIFHYGGDTKTIEKVDLFEGSLVAVPANPNALVSTRELTQAELSRLEAEHANG